MGTSPAEQCLLLLIMAFGCAVVAWFSTELKKSLKPVFLLKSKIHYLSIFLIQTPTAIAGRAGDMNGSVAVLSSLFTVSSFM